jgi:tetratricopeptide (TPR) repeat protein
MIHTNMTSARPSLPAIAFGLIGALLLPLLTQPAWAQDSGPSQQQKAMHYSLYYENFKNENFESAKSDLAWIIENAPGFPKGDDRNFKRQVELYEGLAANATDEKQQRAYLDTAATLLTSAPKRMEKHGISYEKYAWEIREGRFRQEHEDALSDLEVEGLKDAEAHYRKAFELAPQEVDPYYIQQVLRGHLDANEQDQALQFLKTVEKKRGDDEEVSKIISSVRDDIFGKNPQAKVRFLEKKLKANPDSAQVMLSLFDAYVQQGNIKKASKLAPKLMKTNPPAETVREIAEMRLEDGRPKDALKAYDRAAKQGAELKPEDYYNRGDAYMQMGNFSKARSQFRKAIERKPDYGQAYLAIGDLYARAVSECSGSQLGRKDKAVYWVAVDKYQQAIEADSSVASVANSKIRSYKDVFPTQEDIFYREDWDPGASFTIDYGCYSWINETTTVRQAP